MLLIKPGAKSTYKNVVDAVGDAMIIFEPGENELSFLKTKSGQ